MSITETSSSWRYVKTKDDFDDFKVEKPSVLLEMFSSLSVEL